MTNGFDEAWNAVAGIEGWLTKGQGKALFDAVRRIPQDSHVVEIGSHRGRSTILLAKAKPPGSQMVIQAVDPFMDPRWGGGESCEAIFRRNLAAANVCADVSVFRGTSEQALPHWNQGGIGMLFIDGAHDLQSVLLDIDGWEPFVVDGGTVCIHDAFSSVGVTRALLKRHLFSRSFRYVGSVRSLAVFQRGQLSSVARLVSAGWMAGRLPYFARNVCVKLARRRGWVAPQRILLHAEPGDPY